MFNLGVSGLVKMELHWGLIAPEDSLLAPPLSWFYGQSLATDVEKGRLTTLLPEAHLLYLCAHAELGHGESQLKLVRYLDMHLLICRTEAFDWEMFLEQAVACRWTFAAERALTLAQKFFGTPLPETLLAEIQRQRPQEEDVSFVLHVQRPGTRWDRTKGRLRALPRRRRLHMFLALLIPPPRYVRWRYNVQRDWQLPFYYVYRWLDAAADVIGLGSNRRA